MTDPWRYEEETEDPRISGDSARCDCGIGECECSEDECDCVDER